MTKIGNIISLVTYDPILRKYGRRMPFLVLNNEFSNTDDPMLNIAKEVALRDMLDDTTYIPSELIDKE